jgi:hypothetical protein
MTTNKYLILAIASLLISSAVIFFINRHAHAGKVYLKAVAVKTPLGWGYDIMAGDRIFIRQEYVPVLTGNQVFKTPEDALRVGRRVVEKISRNQSPALSRQDLEELGILKK